MSLSKKSKVILGIIAIVVITVFVVYKYAMQPPTQIENKKVDFTGTSSELLNKIQENTDEWQDKVVVITGNISSIEEKGIILSSSIFCQFKNETKIPVLSADLKITLKGRVIGYDDLLEEIKLDQCIIQK